MEDRQFGPYSVDVINRFYGLHDPELTLSHIKIQPHDHSTRQDKRSVEESITELDTVLLTQTATGGTSTRQVPQGSGNDTGCSGSYLFANISRFNQPSRFFLTKVTRGFIFVTVVLFFHERVLREGGG